jgi:hypothetical protein
MDINYESAPNNFGDSWQRYVEHGIPPGSFGEALLCNRLREAFGCADHININLIPQHVQWLWDNLPFEAWGSDEAFQAWSDAGGLNGKRKHETDNTD